MRSRSSARTRIAPVIAERIRGARRVVMPGVAHLPPLEAPERFRDIVVPFLEADAIAG